MLGSSHFRSFSQPIELQRIGTWRYASDHEFKHEGCMGWIELTGVVGYLVLEMLALIEGSALLTLSVGGEDHSGS